LIDAQLSFKPQVNVIVAKAHMTVGQILRCFRSRDTETLIRAFITYVRPLLEYCTPIWSPYSVGMIKRVESVQRAAITACNTGTVLVVKMTLKVS